MSSANTASANSPEARLQPEPWLRAGRPRAAGIALRRAAVGAERRREASRAGGVLQPPSPRRSLLRKTCSIVTVSGCIELRAVALERFGELGIAETARRPRRAAARRRIFSISRRRTTSSSSPRRIASATSASSRPRAHRGRRQQLSRAARRMLASSRPELQHALHDRASSCRPPRRAAHGARRVRRMPVARDEAAFEAAHRGGGTGRSARAPGTPACSSRPRRRRASRHASSARLPRKSCSAATRRAVGPVSDGRRLPRVGRDRRAIRAIGGSVPDRRRPRAAARSAGPGRSSTAGAPRTVRQRRRTPPPPHSASAFTNHVR